MRFGPLLLLACGRSPPGRAAADGPADGTADGAADGGTGCVGNPPVDLFSQRLVGPPTFDLPAYPLSLRGGDLDGDGRPDVVATAPGAEGAPQIIVAFGDGAGGFAGADAYDAPSRASIGPALADWDLDGDLDVLAAGSGDALSWFRNESGVLVEVPAAVAVSSLQIETADLDLDGDADVVIVTDCESNRLDVLLGDGSGGVSDAGTVPIPDEASGCPAFLLGDVDGDGDADVVLWASEAAETGAILLRNDGGTLENAGAIADAGRQPLALLDVDADGDPDLVVRGPGSDGCVVLALLSDGGAFAAERELSDRCGYWVRLADLEGDGAPDLAINGTVVATRVHWNDGGQFGSPRSAAGASGDILPLDLDSDGVDELVTSAGDAAALAVIGAGECRRLPREGVPVRAGPEAIATADFDLDGDLDAAVANRESVSILVNDGAARMTETRIDTDVGRLEGVAAGDLDGDGDPDLVIVSEDPGTMAVLRNDGAAFSESQRSAPNAVRGAESVALGDLDADGDADAAVVRNSGALGFYENDGDGGLAGLPPLTLPPTSESIALVDLDGDGDLDVAAAVEDPGLVVVVGNAGGWSFKEIGQWEVDRPPEALAAGDVDGDGDSDLAAVSGDANGTGGVSGAPGVLNVLVNDGTASFVPGDRLPVGINPRSIALADLDGDGDLDVATANAGDDTASVLRNDGAGRFDPEGLHLVGVAPYFVGVAQLDGGGPDLLVASKRSYDVTVILGATP